MLALTRLDLAELLPAHDPDEHEAALEHLVLSMSEFSVMRMQPAVTRATEVREKYGDVVAPHAAADKNPAAASGSIRSLPAKAKWRRSVRAA